MAAKAIPDGYHTVTPYLIVAGAVEAIDYYRRAFGATESLRLDCGNGKIGHAEIKIGNSTVMLADEFPEMGARGPHAFGGTPVSLLLYVENADAVTQQAIDAGGKEVRPVKDQFYGDRSGMVADPYGHVWTIATHKEDLTPDEINRRFEAIMHQPAATQ
jgi:PhnB protein